MLTIFLICSYLGVSFTSPKPVIFGKSTTGQGEDYTTEFLLDYEYIKNHYRLMTIDLSRWKELDADPEAIHQIEFAWQLKKLHHDYNATDAGNDQSMFVSIILKIKEMKLKFSQWSVTVLLIMTNY